MLESIGRGKVSDLFPKEKAGISPLETFGNGAGDRPNGAGTVYQNTEVFMLL